jgi:hypothetical protein
MQNSFDSLLVPVVKVAELQAIPYADTIDGPIQYLTPEEFKQKFNCDYMEGLYIAHDQLAKYLTTLDEHVERLRINCDANTLIALLSPKALQRAVCERLTHPLMSVAIRKFSIAAGVGYGLFATAIIPTGTVIIYSGEFLERNEQNKYRLLTHGAIAERGKVDCYTFSCTTTYSISARDTGGIARFINHMPVYSADDIARHVRMLFLDPNYVDDLLHYIKRRNSYCHQFQRDAGFFIHAEVATLLQDYREALCSSQNKYQTYLCYATQLAVLEAFIVDKYQFMQTTEDKNTNELNKLLFPNGSNKYKICTANLVKTSYVDENGCMFWVLVATRNIAANEQLGYSYGLDNFTASGQFPRYFINGGRELLPRSAYRLDDSVKISFFNPVIDHQDGSRREQAAGVSVEILEKTLLTCPCVTLYLENQTLSNVENVPSSTYSIRDQLCDREILPSIYYGRLSYTIAAVTFLRDFLPNVDVQAYYANPRELEMATHGTPTSLDTYKVNIVCRASTESQFCSMINFFGAANRKHCRTKMILSESIGQIVLTDVNEVDQHSRLCPITEELSTFVQRQ